MKKHSVHEMCRVAIIAAVYVALTMVNPISWGTMQFRVDGQLAIQARYRARRIAEPIIIVSHIGVLLLPAARPLGNLIPCIVQVVRDTLPDHAGVE